MMHHIFVKTIEPYITKNESIYVYIKIHFDIENGMQNFTEQYNYITNVWNYLNKMPWDMYIWK